MALPILEKIAAELVTRLEQITTGNGYEFTASSVDRVNRLADGFTPRNLAIVVVQKEETENPELSLPGNPPAVAYDATFFIHGFVRESDSSTTPAAITENQMIAAIKLAIANGSNWHQFDDNAINTRIETGTPFETNDGEHDGATVALVVTYRTSELNPYLARSQ